MQQHHLALHGGRRQRLALLVDQLQPLQRDRLSVRAEDDELPSRDGDPAIELDMQRGTLVVRTERARVEATVTRPQ